MQTAISAHRPDGLQPLLTTIEVLRILNVTRQTLWRLEKAGEFPRPVLIGTAKRWQPDDIAAFLKHRRSA